MNTFSISAIIKSSWTIFKKHWKFLVPAMIATGIIEVILDMIQRSAQNGPGGVAVIIAELFSIIISIIIALGWAHALLQLVRHDRGDWNDFKTDPAVWLRLVKVALWYIGYLIVYSFLATILFLIIAAIGYFASIMWLASLGGILAMIAFILVAIYFAIRYMFVVFAAIDFPELSSRKIFKKAGDLTAGHMLDLLGFAIVLGLINIVGLICLVVGLAITIPVTKTARAKAYTILKNGHAHTPVLHAGATTPMN